MEKPGGLQHTAEIVEEFISEQADGIIATVMNATFLCHHDWFFILVCNLLGLIPGFESPTANPAVPLGCAVLTFVYYHFHGMRIHGFKYIKQFIKP